MADEEEEHWSIFEAFERAAYEEQHKVKPRKSDVTGIRNRFNALSQQQRRERVQALTAFREGQEVLRTAERAISTALAYTGQVPVGNGKSFEAYIKLEKAARAGANKTLKLLTTLVETLPEGDAEKYFVHGHLTSTVHRRIYDVVEDVDKLLGKDKKERREVWLMRLRSAKWRSQAPLTEPGWTGYWKIGAGAFGAADLWVKQNTEGRVIDRVVVKNTIMKEDIWNDRSLWIHGLPNEEGVSTEVQSLYNIRPRIGSSSVVKIRNWRIERTDRLHRIYMEFCPNGDAESLIRYENIYGKHPRFDEGNENKDVKEGGPFIPEPLLWFLFENLTKACLLMERGELDRFGQAPWDLIVHRDMKVANIFFGSNTSDVYRGYPEPKLGDFGIAVIAPSKNNPGRDDEGNVTMRRPENIPEMGTVGNKPPEQYIFLQKDESTEESRQYEPLETGTNVWGMGIIMYSLVICDHSRLNHFEARHKANAELQESDWDIPPFDASPQAYYSDELLDLIRGCLAYRPRDRLSADDVMRAIRQNTAPGKNDKSEGMRLADASDIRFLTEHGVNFVCADRYTVGSNLWVWDPEVGSTAVDDPPKDQEPVLPGEEDPLGNDPGGRIEVNHPKNAAAPEEDNEGNPSDNGDGPEEPDGGARGGNEPERGGGENEEDAPDERSEGTIEPPAGRPKRTKRKKAPADEQESRPKRQKPPPPAIDEDEDGDGDAGEDGAVSKTTKKNKNAKGKKPAAGVAAADGKKPKAAPAKAKAKPQQKGAPDDAVSARQLRANNRAKN